MCFNTPDFQAPKPPAAAPPAPIPGTTQVKKRKPTIAGRESVWPLRISRNDSGVGLKS